MARVRRLDKNASAIILCLLVAFAGLNGGCHGSAASGQDAQLIARIDEALARSGRYLMARQGADGGWRSGVYGFFKDGNALTPHVLMTLCDLPRHEADQQQSLDKGADYLAKMVAADGRLRDDLELAYPVYTAAEASIVLSKVRTTPQRQRAVAAWLACLRGYQQVDELGWRPDDLEYGGWGYAARPPLKQKAGAFVGPWDWPNLSATLYAIEALQVSAIAPSDRVHANALGFGQRCQNYTEHPAAGESRVLDGGFFFSPQAGIRNKAGSATDEAGRVGFNSYGSMTCDGIRLLLDCGLPSDHPRVVAARRWLAQNFSVEHNPGQFVAANEDLRDATYYYYVCSLAQALIRLGERHISTDGGSTDWATAMASELLKRQRPDGSWVNPFTDGKEDEPLVATPLASTALVICRQMLSR